MRNFLSSLRRHTSTGLYIPELDGLRFAAIAAVFLYHLSGDVLRHTPDADGSSPSSFLFLLCGQLNVGVPLFFAISGMILGLPFARYRLQGGPPVSLRRYFLRRVTRLEPPYIAALLLLFSLKAVAGRGAVREMIPHLAASFAYLHTFIYKDMSTINPVAWSLEVEVQFYVMAPLLALVFAIRNTISRRAVLMGAIACASIAFPWTDMTVSRNHFVTWMAHLTLVGNIQYFLTGFLIADIFLLTPPEGSRTRGWDLATAAGWPVLAILLVEAPRAAFVLLPGIILLLYIAAFYGPASRNFFANLWIAVIGGMCYSIYLLHNYAIAALGFLTERIGRGLPLDVRLGIQIAVMTPVILSLCVIFYRLIEHPCMRSDWPLRLKNFVRRRIFSLEPESSEASA